MGVLGDAVAAACKQRLRLVFSRWARTAALQVCNLVPSEELLRISVAGRESEPLAYLECAIINYLPQGWIDAQLFVIDDSTNETLASGNFHEIFSNVQTNVFFAVRCGR